MSQEDLPIVEKLKRAIYTGVLLPGEHLRQSELAKQFGVSRVPLREALLILANIGLVEHTLNSGFRVTKRTREEYDQLLWLIGILETEIYRNLRPVEEAEIAQLHAINSKMSSLSGTRDEIPFTALNHQFHQIIWAMSDAKLLVQQLENVWPLTEPFIGMVYTNREYLKRAVKEHEGIIEALVEPDLQALLERTEEHRQSSSGAATRLRSGGHFMGA